MNNIINDFSSIFWGLRDQLKFKNTICQMYNEKSEIACVVYTIHEGNLRTNVMRLLRYEVKSLIPNKLSRTKNEITLLMWRLSIQTLWFFVFCFLLCVERWFWNWILCAFPRFLIFLIASVLCNFDIQTSRSLEFF